MSYGGAADPSTMTIGLVLIPSGVFGAGSTAIKGVLGYLGTARSGVRGGEPG